MDTYHYTVGSKLAAILRSGALLPITADREPGERAVLWFSTQPGWEPTATKLLLNPQTGELRRATRLELHRTLGLFRFALPAADERLVRWPALRHVARIGDAMARHLARSGRERGARPTDWSGSLVPITLEDTTFEAFDEQRGWHRVVLADAVERLHGLDGRILHAPASTALQMAAAIQLRNAMLAT
ncbi:MAG TPA: hypothetical protein PKV98_01700 [Burkholderiaceae bacterium]|nr:hypothetical protein [Burkholderiaceae bacterium]